MEILNSRNVCCFVVHNCLHSLNKDVKITNYNFFMRECRCIYMTNNRFTVGNIQLQRLRWSGVSVLAFGTQVRGFKPGRSRRIFRAKKPSARLPSEGK